ncbi:MAG TPA: hypothetical protein VJP80_02265 [Candidatus Saccharimonadales bacterium]|nr:hypothetical protein [Candidatus Saccharimonadales bacterium]
MKEVLGASDAPRPAGEQLAEVWGVSAAEYKDATSVQDPDLLWQTASDAAAALSHHGYTEPIDFKRALSVVLELGAHFGDVEQVNGDLEARARFAHFVGGVIDAGGAEVAIQPAEVGDAVVFRPASAEGLRAVRREELLDADRIARLADLPSKEFADELLDAMYANASSEPDEVHEAVQETVSFLTGDSIATPLGSPARELVAAFIERMAEWARLNVTIQERLRGQ